MKASELMKKLENDPKYQEMQRKQDEEFKKKIEESKILERPFIEVLHSHGFVNINDLDDLLHLKKVDSKLISLILEWIPKISNKHNSQEILIRSLAVAKEPFDGEILKQLFDSPENSQTFRWAIGNTIACTLAQNITQWLEEKLMAVEQPMENQMLVYAAIKYFDKEKAKTLIKNLFNYHPLQVADALTYIGNKDDIDFLLEKRKGVNKVQRAAIDKAIKKISKKI